MRLFRNLEQALRGLRLNKANTFLMTLGIMIGIAFFAVSKALGYIVLVYHMPPLVGASLPTLAFAAAAGLLYRRIP